MCRIQGRVKIVSIAPHLGVKAVFPEGGIVYYLPPQPFPFIPFLGLERLYPRSPPPQGENSPPSSFTVCLSRLMENPLSLPPLRGERSAST